jgi:hypothetical protein
VRWASLLQLFIPVPAFFGKLAVDLLVHFRTKSIIDAEM